MSTKVTWQTITPIIGDVVISPWNLLIGGLLITNLDFKTASLAIILGYLILSIFFYFYGRLGYLYNKKTSELLEPIFGKQGTKYFFSIVLAIGQIGWFAIICQIGGESLANLFHINQTTGIIIYAFIMFLIASMNLYKVGIIKSFIIIASFGLIFYLLWDKVRFVDFTVLWNSTGNSKSLLWGVSVVVASLISFVTIIPDFFSQLKTNRDTILVILLGLLIPGIIMGMLGVIVFFDQPEISFIVLIGTAGSAWLGHVFNITTNTDASVTIYTAGNRLNYMFKINFKLAVAITTFIGTLMALSGATNYLENWLVVLSGVYPTIIAITIIYYYVLNPSLKGSFQNIQKRERVPSLALIISVSISLLALVLKLEILLWTTMFVSAGIYYIVNYKYAIKKVR